MSFRHDNDNILNIAKKNLWRYLKMHHISDHLDFVDLLCKLSASIYLMYFQTKRAQHVWQ